MALTLRHYLFPPEGEPQRLSKRLVDGLIFGTDALPHLAETRQRVLTIVLENDAREPQEIVRTEGSIWHFDAEGKIRDGLQDALREGMQGMDGLIPAESDAKVVSLEPKLSKKRYAEKHRWDPTPADIETVIADIWPKKGTKRLRDVKGIAPKRPPLTYEAKHALEAITRNFYGVPLELDRLKEPALKGLAFEARQRADDDPDFRPLYRAAAEMAELQQEIMRRRRTGRGVWYAVVDVTRWDDGRHGTIIAEYVERCDGQAAAVTAARRLLTEHADKFSADTTVEVSIVTELERQADASAQVD